MYSDVKNEYLLCKDEYLLFNCIHCYFLIFYMFVIVLALNFRYRLFAFLLVWNLVICLISWFIFVITKVIFQITLAILDTIKEELVECKEDGEAVLMINSFLESIVDHEVVIAVDKSSSSERVDSDTEEKERKVLSESLLIFYHLLNILHVQVFYNSFVMFIINVICFINDFAKVSFFSLLKPFVRRSIWYRYTAGTYR